MIGMYLCGASREWKRVRMWADKLEQTGRIKITFRWFDGAEKWAGQDAKTQQEKTLDEVAQIALDDLNGVASAQVVWLFWPKAPTIGAFVELGAALERKRTVAEIVGTSEKPFTPVDVRSMFPRIIVTGAGFNDSIFTALVDYREITDAFGFHEATRIANNITREQRR